LGIGSVFIARRKCTVRRYMPYSPVSVCLSICIDTAAHITMQWTTNDSLWTLADSLKILVTKQRYHPQR